MSFFINNLLCNGCGKCTRVCFANAIHETNNTFIIDQALCLNCGECKNVCCKDAIAEPCSVV